MSLRERIEQEKRRLGASTSIDSKDDFPKFGEGSDTGYIYILVNQSFPEWVKIGYADDMKARLKQLNRSECTPFPFQVYALYEVGNRLVDLDLHTIIDKLNPSLRAVGEVNGKKRVREFYSMTPEDAFEIILAIAKMHGRQDKLKKFRVDISKGSFEAVVATEEPKQESISEDKTPRAKNFSFSRCGIPVGSVLEYYREGDCLSGVKCQVIDDKRVIYNGEKFSLSGLAVKLSGMKPMQGPRYFKYNGELLVDIRARLGV